MNLRYNVDNAIFPYAQMLEIMKHYHASNCITKHSKIIIYSIIHFYSMHQYFNFTFVISFYLLTTLSHPVIVQIYFINNNYVDTALVTFYEHSSIFLIPTVHAHFPYILDSRYSILPLLVPLSYLFSLSHSHNCNDNSLP